MRRDRREWPARPCIARGLSTLGPWLWFSVLAIAVAGPLLGEGYLLLLD